jgi:hypothetical protein
MTQSAVKINSNVLSIRVKKAIFLVNENRKRIFQERILHYLFQVNKRNYLLSRKWWSFLVPKKYKTKIDKKDIPNKILKKIACNWGDLNRLNKMLSLCIIGHEVNLTTEDMDILTKAEFANKWLSGATLRTEQEINQIWS